MVKRLNTSENEQSVLWENRARISHLARQHGSKAGFLCRPPVRNGPIDPLLTATSARAQIRTKGPGEHCPPDSLIFQQP